MSMFKGWFGEKKTSFKMWFSLDKRIYKVFHNVIIPSSEGTTQIDHIVVSQYGVFIVETKNKGGWIYGAEDQATWTQTFYNKKFTFQNPLRQTYRQRILLADFLEYQHDIRPIIYFVGKCKFKTQLPHNVIKSGLGKYIKMFKEKILSQDEVDRIVGLLEKHITESDLTTKDHIRSLQERYNSDNTCPNCGANLVLKTAKKGENAGVKFLGCENFPQCRFSKSA